MSNTKSTTQATRLDTYKAGVKTDEGKSIVRYNSFKHGLTGKSLLGTFSEFREFQLEYDSLLEGFKESLQPKNAFEEACIHTMAKAQFKLRRADRLEADLFREKEDLIKDSIWLSVSDSSAFELMLRYRSTLINEFNRALDALIKSRSFFQLDLFGKAGGRNGPL